MNDLWNAMIKDFRFERKFLLEHTHPQKAEAMIKQHPSLFKEIFHERQVNNIYLDTYNYKHYKENIIGHSQRSKVRIRWYGSFSEKVQSPNLEIKVKQNALNGKLTYALKPFYFNKDLSSVTLQEALSKSSLPAEVLISLKSHAPVLYNSYKRKYFISADGNFRVTLDYALASRKLSPTFHNKDLSQPAHNLHTILELKYKNSLDTLAENISSRFPSRMVRNSKYINGLENNV